MQIKNSNYFRWDMLQNNDRILEKFKVQIKAKILWRLFISIFEKLYENNINGGLKSLTSNFKVKIQGTAQKYLSAPKKVLLFLGCVVSTKNCWQISNFDWIFISPPVATIHFRMVCVETKVFLRFLCGRSS